MKSIKNIWNEAHPNTYTTKAKENGIVVYTVGLGSDVSTDVLKAIAQGTGV